MGSSDFRWFPMSERDPGRLDVSAIVRRFDRAAGSFAGADFVHRHTFDGLMERLAPMTLRPATIVDLGSATGSGSLALAAAFRKARVYGVDLSGQMLERAASARRWFSRVRQVQGDAGRLPLRSGCADLVVANLLLPWLPDPAAALSEANRVLRKDGLLMFATLGPSSLGIIRDAWSDVDDGPHASVFADMHDIGDALVHAGLRDPVLDVDELSVTYRDPRSLFDDLTATGARNALVARRPGLTGKRRFARFEEALLQRAAGSVIEVRLELVFGHAWGSGPRQDPAEFRLSPADIGGRRRPTGTG